MPVQVCVSGGKGGTGKSFVATNVAVLLARRGYRVVLADLDVEAPNDHVLLGLERLEAEEPVRVFFPFIDYSKCTACGVCAKVCDTGAIVMARGRPPMVMPRLCSGCKACLVACPYKAIDGSGERVIGYSYSTPVKGEGYTLRLITGVLREGEEHTPPAVRVVRDRALEEARDADVLIVDTGAGTGNHISMAIQGSRLLIAVTEPTPLGLHDLRGILEIGRGMEIETWVVVNRAGLGSEERHVELAKSYGVRRLFRIPFSKAAALAYARGRPVVEAFPDDPASKALVEIADAVEEVIRG